MDSNQKHVVDGAIDGKRYTLDDATAIPGPVQSVTSEEVIVFKGDTYYTFIHDPYFAATKPPGSTAVALVIVGIVMAIEGIRRQHFSRAPLPWQVGG